jgi:ATP-dependent DNA helicase HFM1/MER3
MTEDHKVQKYQALVTGNQLLESHLHENLIENLNAEIALKTIRNVGMALEWLKSTFLYIRVQKNPRHYLDGKGYDDIKKYMEDLVLDSVKLLIEHGMVKQDAAGSDLESTELGKSMARCYIRYETMVNVSKIKESSEMADLVKVYLSYYIVASSFNVIRTSRN